jgi:hypothetical protein
MSIVGNWKLNGNANDALGLNNGTPTDVTWVQGIENQAGKFNASSSKIVLPNTASVAGFTKASISVLYKPLATPSANAPVYYEATTGGAVYTRFGIFHLSTGDLFCVVRDSATGIGHSIIITTPFTLGKWYHIVYSVNTVSNYDAVYIDSKLRGVNTAAKGTIEAGAPSAPITIGNYSTGYLNGLLDDLKLYNHDLIQSEAKNLYMYYKGFF